MKRKNIRTKERGQQPVQKRNTYNKISNTDWFIKNFHTKKQGEVIISI